MDRADTNCEQLFLALGRAANKLWSGLPQEAQQKLFEEAVAVGGEALREPLALFLHERHPRTTDALKQDAVQEPDSLGG
jgi:hypothetical protein